MSTVNKAKQKIIFAIKKLIKSKTLLNWAAVGRTGRRCSHLEVLDMEIMTLKWQTLPYPLPKTQEQQKLHFPEDQYPATCYSEVFKKQYLLGQFYFWMSELLILSFHPHEVVLDLNQWHGEHNLPENNHFHEMSQQEPFQSLLAQLRHSVLFGLQ